MTAAGNTSWVWKAWRQKSPLEDGTQRFPQTCSTEYGYNAIQMIKVMSICIKCVVLSNMYEVVCAGPLRWSHMSWVTPQVPQCTPEYPPVPLRPAHMCPSPPVIPRYWLLFTNITKHWNCLCNYVPWQPFDKQHLFQQGNILCSSNLTNQLPVI